MLSKPVLGSIADWLVQQLGSDYREIQAVPSGAGCINDTYELATQGRDRLFVKVGSPAQLPMYQQEIIGLDLLRQCAEIRVPKVVGCARLAACSVLVLEFIELQPIRGEAEANFGQALAALHRIEGRAFGLEEDNFIGRSHQINGWRDDWWTFYCEQRLLPQTRLAQIRGMRREVLQRLQELIVLVPDCYIDYQPPASLLHGDLWSGNMALDETGLPTLFDPAVYFGDAETDLAMSRMFGAPGRAFYAAYEQQIQPRDGHEQRRLLYDLYHWLNHFNLFGVGYLGQVENTLDRLLIEMQRDYR